jgi:taurine dioxygenase
VSDSKERGLAVSRLEIVSCGRHAGAEIRGVNLAEPLSSEDRDLMVDVLATYGVLLVRNQHLTELQQLAFTRAFGRVAPHPIVDLTPGTPGAEADPHVAYLNDLPGLQYAGKARLRGAVGWHTDLSYMPEPAVYSVLYALELPAAGGDTLFSNLVAAYDALDADDRWTLERFWCVHWLFYEQESVAHPLVRLHPHSLLKSLYVSPTVSRHVVGLSQWQSRSLLASLARHCTRARFAWRHVWRPHDLLMWDNRHTIHARTPFDPSERRVMRRTQTAGEPVIPAWRRDAWAWWFDHPIDHRHDPIGSLS